MSGHITRVVLDTNLVLSALIFQQGRLVPLRTLWQTGAIRPLVSRLTVAELMRVLGYPKFKLTSSEQEELLADYLPYCETHVMSQTTASNACLPRSRRCALSATGLGEPC